VSTLDLAPQTLPVCLILQLFVLGSTIKSDPLKLLHGEEGRNPDSSRPDSSSLIRSGYAQAHSSIIPAGRSS